MEYLKGQSRTQLTLYTTCLEDMIPEDNSVRAIDQFVNSLDFETLGFKTLTFEGRPPYNPADLLKPLYLWVYEPHTLFTAIRTGVYPKY
jgi:transposase